MPARYALAALIALATMVTPLPAQAVDPDTIVKALLPKARPPEPITRSFRPLGPSRGIEIEGGEQQAEAPPRIDLYVHFEYDQAALTLTDARLTLDGLAKALKDPRLAAMRFMIIGHTDARGNDGYNLDLSRRRAEAVRQYLIQFHRIAGDALKAEGKGRAELKDPARPEDAINRRVEIRTVVAPSS